MSVQIEYTPRQVGSGYIVTCSDEPRKHFARQCVKSFLKETDYDIFPYGPNYTHKFLLLVPKGFCKRKRFRKMREALQKI